MYSLNLLLLGSWCGSTCLWCTVSPLDADSREDQNNCSESVRSWWHWAVSSGQSQDWLLQSTGEIAAATITADSHGDRSHVAHLLCLSLFVYHFLSHLHTHKPLSFLFSITRATAHCPSAWPRPTCHCPTCLTRRVHPLDLFCQSEMFVLASGLASFTHSWERYVFNELMLTSLSVPYTLQSHSKGF